jgi:threonine dehydratase
MSNDAVTRADVIAAQDRIAGHLRRTPTLRTALPTVDGPVEVVVKLEYLQLGGCFKARGSLNAVLHAADDGRLDDAGVLVASGGNAAIGAALRGPDRRLPLHRCGPRDRADGESGAAASVGR